MVARLEDFANQNEQVFCGDVLAWNTATLDMQKIVLAMARTILVTYHTGASNHFIRSTVQYFGMSRTPRKISVGLVCSCPQKALPKLEKAHSVESL